MRQRPWSESLRMLGLRLSSGSVDDGNDDGYIRSERQPSKILQLWRKDPRNGSVTGVLICMLERGRVETCLVF